MDHYYNFSNTVCFKIFISRAYSLTAYGLILFQAPTFISPGNNLKFDASVATCHFPCLETAKGS